MATPSPTPTDSSGTSNANLLSLAQGTSGTLATGSVNMPVTDFSQLSAGSQMYGSGGQQVYSAGGAGTEPTIESSVGDWANKFYTDIANSPTTLQQFSTEAQLAGLVGANANVTQLYSAWQKLIVEAYNYNINKQQLTPWDVLANSIPGVSVGSYKNNAGQAYVTEMSSQEAADLAAKVAAKDTSKTTTASEVDINYTDPDTARYVLNQASQTLLGRQATNEEVANFTKTLNSDEANFPKMTQDTKTADNATTTATTPGATSDVGTQGQAIVGYDAAGNPIYGPTTTVGSTASTNTTGNTTDTVVSLGEQDYTRYGRQQLAEDAAKASPDYGAYQAAGPLFQAFLGSLKGAVSGVGSNG